MKIKQVAIYGGLVLGGLWLWGKLAKSTQPKVNFEDVTVSRQYGGLSTTPYKPATQPKYTVIAGNNGQPVFVDTNKNVFI